MKAYKYRSGNKEYLKRDLETISQNYIWASEHNKLNDPCETQINTTAYNDAFDTLSKITAIPNFLSDPKIKNALDGVNSAVENLYKVNKGFVGIFSLSKSYIDELLWAYYANSHFGFCIEYDLDKLNPNFNGYDYSVLEVEYQSQPPGIDFRDARSDKETTVKKIAGYKSSRWKHEEEIRIVTDVYGRFPINPEAITGIYFGLRMPEETSIEIIKQFSNRDISFYKIERISNSYDFKKVNIEIDSQKNYLKEIPIKVTKSGVVKFSITKKEYYRVHKKGILEFELEQRVNEESLKWLICKCKTAFFNQAKNVFVFFRVKGEIDKGLPWATGDSKEGIINVKVNKRIDDL